MEATIFLLKAINKVILRVRPFLDKEKEWHDGFYSLGMLEICPNHNLFRELSKDVPLPLFTTLTATDAYTYLLLVREHVWSELKENSKEAMNVYTD